MPRHTTSLRPKKRTSTLLLLVRHGRTPTTGKVLPGRAKGLHLSDEGVSAAGALAKRLASAFEVAALYSSPMERAKETAAPIAQAVGLKSVVKKGLLEIDYGDWTGIEIRKAAKLPEWRLIQSSPQTFRFPGGESFLEMQVRVNDAVAELAFAHPREVVVAVSHADPIKIAVVTALQAPLISMHHIEVAPCSVTALEIEDGRRLVTTVGDTGAIGIETVRNLNAL